MKQLVASLMAVLTVCVLGFSCINSASAQTLTTDKIQKKVNVETLTLPNQLVSFEIAAVTDVDNQDVLTFSTANKTTDKVISVQAIAFIVNSEGNIIGGQGFTQNADIASNSTESKSVILKNKVGDGNRVILTVWNVSGESKKVFDVNASELVKLVKLQIKGQLNSYLKGRNHMQTKVNYSTATQGSYCAGALSAASAACKCGISSFSCSESGSFSFSCKAQSECPEAPPESE